MNIDDFMDAEVDWLSQRESAVLNDFLGVYQSTLTEIQGRLTNMPGDSFTYRHFREVEGQLSSLVSDLSQKQHAGLSGHIKGTYAQGLDRARDNWVNMESTFGSEDLAAQFSLIQPVIPQQALEELLSSAGAPIARVSSMTAKKIRQSLSQSLILGEGIKAAASRLDGLNFDLEKSRLQLIARMETSRANNSARQQTVEELNRRNPGIEFWEIYRDRVDYSSKTRNHWFSWAVNNTVRNVTLKEFFEVAASDMLRAQQQWSSTTKRKASFSGILWAEVNGRRKGKTAPAHYNDRAVVLPWRPNWTKKGVGGSAVSIVGKVKHPQGLITKLSRQEGVGNYDTNKIAGTRNVHKRHFPESMTKQGGKPKNTMLYGVTKQEISDEVNEILSGEATRLSSSSELYQVASGRVYGREKVELRDWYKFFPVSGPGARTINQRQYSDLFQIKKGNKHPKFIESLKEKLSENEFQELMYLANNFGFW